MRSGFGRGQPRTVYVTGIHHLSKPLVLDERDSGTTSAPITYRSALPCHQAALERACRGARRASVGNCLVCVNANHEQVFKQAGCKDESIDVWC